MLRKISIRALRRCLERVDSEGDYSHVHAPLALWHARRLAAGHRDERPDLEALSVLGRFHRYRYRAIGPKSRRDRDIMIWTFAQRLIAGDESLPSRDALDALPQAIDLATDLLVRAGGPGRRPPVERVLSVWRRLHDAVPDDHPERPMVWNNLRVALLFRFAATRDVTDMDEAVAAARQAVDAASADDPERALFLRYLGTTLVTRHERTQVVTDLDEAVAAWREALRIVPAKDTAERSSLSSLLGFALLTRFLRTKRQADIEDAIVSYRLATQDANDPDHDKHLSNLATALTVRADHTGVTAHREEAEAAQEPAVRAR
ncbi:hypothetical protein HII36_14895 [Nonomuraea sp. NN258]|uniref:hypothetical protein n=1 Tax=Nonomuraea antri TaxID=2730852 RepID=UPI001569036B|nr:hypothetical protein [Nonomuraea antri]NRQ33120.1 hypothetical protein [Nonomuraea antri]